LPKGECSKESIETSGNKTGPKRIVRGKKQTGQYEKMNFRARV
jgi:hypothetical protein